MTTPADDPFKWFDATIALAGVVLTGAWGWTQMQMKWLRDDSQQVESRTMKAIDGLRTEFEKRHDDERQNRDKQHADNRAEQIALRSLVQTNADIARAENRRVMDGIDKINDKLGQIPSRKEVTDLISDKRSNS